MRAGHGRHRGRYLTSREAARLMGAGDFRITVSDNGALSGSGDAVCVPVIEWVGRNLLHPIAESLEESSKRRFRVAEAI